MIERVIIRPTIRQASLTIVTTFGLSMILQEGVRATYGAQPRRMAAPIEGTIPLFGIDYDVYRLFAAAFAALCLIAFFVFLNRTKLGTWIRAVRHDPETATALGVPVARICAITFGARHRDGAARRRDRGADHDRRVPHRRRHPAVLLHGGDHRRPRQSAGHGRGRGPARRPRRPRHQRHRSDDRAHRLARSS